MVTEGRTGMQQPGGTTLLDRAVSYTLGSLDLVSGDALTCPTPCREWDLRTLLAHLTDSFATLHEAVAAGHVRPGTLPWPDPSRDAVEVLRGYAGRLAARPPRVGGGLVRVGGCSLPVGVVTCVGALEILVHGWDIARACGHRRAIPPQLAETMLRMSSLFVTDDDRPARFAVPVTLPPRASAGDRLVAFLGRDPR